MAYFNGWDWVECFGYIYILFVCVYVRPEMCLGGKKNHIWQSQNNISKYSPQNVLSTLSIKTSGYLFKLCSCINESIQKCQTYLQLPWRGCIESEFNPSLLYWIIFIYLFGIDAKQVQVQTNAYTEVYWVLYRQVRTSATHLPWKQTPSRCFLTGVMWLNAIA